jgi:hypothetical protein
MDLGKGRIPKLAIAFLIFSTSVTGQTGKSFKYRFDGNLRKSNFVVQNQCLTIDYSLDELNIENITNSNGTFYRLSVPGHSATSIAGRPELPVFSKLIILPENSTPEITISEVRTTKVNPAVNNLKGILYPSQESSVKQEESKKTEFAIDRKLYRTKGLIHSDTVTITRLGKVRGKQLANLTISPVRYNPGENTLEVITSMKIDITYKGISINSLKELKVESPLFGEVLEKGTLNYSPSDVIPGYTDQPVEMIILSDTTFKEFIKPLIDWKIQKGYKLDLIYRGEGSAGNSYSELKDAITSIYNTSSASGHPPEYLLIIGDADKIPYYGSGNVTDMYYGEFDGEGDFIPDMFIGRIPASDTNDVKSAVKKIIQYEKFEFADTNKFYTNALALTGKDVNYGSYMNGQVRYAVTNYLNSTNKINNYPFYYPDGYTKKDSVLKLISQGVSFINYTGHGSANSWLHLDLKSSDVQSLNNLNMYPFIISNACRTASFNDTASLGNKMLLSSDKGAIGYIGCTNDSYWDEDFYWAVGAGTPGDNPKYSDTGLGAYDRWFHTHGEAPSGWYTTMGQINYAGNLSVSASSSIRKKYYWETYALLGDPSVIPIVGTPLAFTVSLPDTIPNGMTSLSLSVEPFAYVAVSHFNTLWDASYSSPSGSVSLKMPGLSNDSCLVVITGRNRKPIIKTIYISSVHKEFINLTDPGLSDTKGNNNGRADFGETIDLNLKINNLGLTDANNLTATISSTSPWVSISKNFTAIGTLPAKSEISLSDLLEFTINNNVPDLGIITINLSLKDSKTEKKFKIDITVHSPNLEIINCLIDDSQTGNNNSIADPGETFNLVFQVRNLGSSSTSGQFNLVSQNQELMIPDQNIKSGILQFGEVSEIPVMVKLSDYASFGDFISVSSVLDCNPFIVNNDFTFRVGKVRESFEAASFKIFPWINLSSRPWVISQVSTVDGSLSAHSGSITHNEVSSLMIRANYEVPDTLKFYYKVSSEPNYDYLAFKVNDAEVFRQSGEQSWTKASLLISQGINKLEWVYSKDNSVSQGADGSWIDLIDFSQRSPVSFIGRDLEVARIVAPIQKDVFGFEPVTVKVLNLGNDTIKGFNLAFAINDRTPISQFFDNTLPPCNDSLSVTFEKRADLDLNGHYMLSIFGLNNNDDYDGNDTLRVNLNNNEVEQSVNVFPNPFTDKLNINLNSKLNTRVRILLVNPSGKQVISLEKDLIEGENQIVLETGAVSPSYYILTIRGGTILKSVPLIKVSH